MRRGYLVILALFLAGCAGGLRGVASDQTESLSIEYRDGMGTRDMTARSSDGELFIGTLIWIKDLGSSGRYKGALVGDKGRTLDVQLECNTFTTKCVGTARSASDKMFFIR